MAHIYTILCNNLPAADNQHARFLEQISTDEFINPQSTEYVQEEFDYFYKVALGLLDRFYPERTITVRSRDPDYVTPYIKAQLRKKNRLVLGGTNNFAPRYVP